MAATGHPITALTPVERRPLAQGAQSARSSAVAALAPLVRRAMPLVTTSVGTALATLAAERAVASLAMRAVERAGLVPARPVEDGITRVVVTHTTIVERTTRTR